MTRASSSRWEKLHEIGGRFSPESSVPSSELAKVIKATEKIVGEEFPDDYSSYIKWSGGRRMVFDWYANIPAPEPYEDVGLDMFLGFDLRNPVSVPSETEYSRGHMPDNAWVIAIDAGGNKYCLKATDGSVHYWDHETSDHRWKTLFRLAGSFSALVKFIRSERKPGEKRKPVTKGMIVPPLKKASRRQ